MKSLYKAFRTQWYTEYKTSGFDVQDHRFGGAMLRLESCRERLLDYCSLKISAIEELSVAILPVGNGAPGEASNRFNSFANYVTANIF